MSDTLRHVPPPGWRCLKTKAFKKKNSLPRNASLSFTPHPPSFIRESPFSTGYSQYLFLQPLVSPSHSMPSVVNISLSSSSNPSCELEFVSDEALSYTRPSLVQPQDSAQKDCTVQKLKELRRRQWSDPDDEVWRLRVFLLLKSLSW